MLRLCLDIGNSRIKVGLFQEDRLINNTVYTSEEVNEILNLLRNHKVQGVIISSTSVIPSKLMDYLESKEINYIILDQHTPIPIWNNYETPLTLGKDRIAGVVGAYRRFPNQNNLVIDAGTCITYDFLDSQNIYQGGNISPGLQLRYRAMHRFTANLPLVNTPKHITLTSKNTNQALESGGFLGLICEIEGIIARFSRKNPTLKVLLTGGDAKILAKYIQNEIFVVPNLILEGLQAILQYNYNE